LTALAATSLQSALSSGAGWEEQRVHFVGRVDWSFTEHPPASSATSSGLSRMVIVGPEQGAVHTELAVGSLAAEGWLQRHIHSFEEALYILEGELILEIGGPVHRLHPGDFALIPLGTWHTLVNGSAEPVRWLSVNTPQRLPPDAGRRDTFFEPGALAPEPLVRQATRPLFGDPALKWVGHYAGTPPQLEALAVPEPAHGRRGVGMDVAILAYSGISVKMLVDRVLGADLLTMFTVDYEPNGAAQIHDHPFEEAYFFLDGEIEGILDGAQYTIRAGDVVFAGVGATHGFFNTGGGRVRWIETQAPQPPFRHAYRWLDHWKRFEEG
jgi:quercetin dioxygenase-like cupin family protein